MKTIFIRHAESTANAGLKTNDPNSITLTPEGHAQAARIVLPGRPDLILTSQYIRTRQTAEPTIAKYPDVPCEVWDIQEFTYLSPAKYKGTTVQQRMPMALEYWERGEADYVDGPGSESFSQMVMRCDQVVNRLKNSGAGLVVAFSHQQFITALQWFVTGRFASQDAQTMRAFRAELIDHPVKNCESVEFNL